MRTAPQKQCKTILLLQSVFLKMSESERLDSECYYPGELSEMQQLRTHNEATERKSLLSSHWRFENARETKQCYHARVLFPPKKWN